MNNVCLVHFKGFSIQLQQPVSGDPQERQEIIQRVNQVLETDVIQQVDLFGSESIESTDLVEMLAKAQYKENISVAKAWDWTYRLRSQSWVIHAEPRFALLDVTGGVKGIPPQGTVFPEKTNDREWHLKQIKVPDAWQAFFSDSKLPGQGIKIALPDTGYLFHPALEGVLFEGYSLTTIEQYDFVENRPGGKGWADNPDPDKFGHGVSVASLIFSPPKGENIPGIAYGAEPIFLRIVPSDSGTGQELFTPPLARAINYAIDREAHIISISMGGYPTLPVRRAILNAQKKGIIVVASAGNHVPFTVWPGAYDQVIAVASSTVEPSIATHSSRGSRVNIAAPGEYVWCATSDSPFQHSYGRRSGTSFATPLVAGVAALWLSHWGLTYLSERYGVERIPLVFDKLLRETSDRPDIPNDWDKTYWGAGIVNAYKLLNVDPLPDPDDPAIQVPPTFEQADHVRLDRGGVETFAHLFEQTLSNSEFIKGISNRLLTDSTFLQELRAKRLDITQWLLSKLFDKSGKELRMFLQTFGQELAFHCGINQSLYKLLEKAFMEAASSHAQSNNSLHNARKELKNSAYVSEYLKKYL